VDGACSTKAAGRTLFVFPDKDYKKVKVAYAPVHLSGSLKETVVLRFDSPVVLEAFPAVKAAAESGACKLRCELDGNVIEIPIRCWLTFNEMVPVEWSVDVEDLRAKADELLPTPTDDSIAGRSFLVTVSGLPDGFTLNVRIPFNRKKE